MQMKSIEGDLVIQTLAMDNGQLLMGSWTDAWVMSFFGVNCDDTKEVQDLEMPEWVTLSLIRYYAW